MRAEIGPVFEVPPQILGRTDRLSGRICFDTQCYFRPPERGIDHMHDCKTFRLSSIVTGCKQT